MLRITHPKPKPGRQTAFQVEFRDGVAHVDSLHPERELALTQHGFEVAEIVEGTSLEALTVPKLREIAEGLGIELTAKVKKAEIIAAITAAPNIPVLE